MDARCPTPSGRFDAAGRPGPAGERVSPSRSDEAAPVSRQPVAHAIMFWTLSSAAIALFAPCVLVPAWRQAEQVREYERKLAGVVAQLEAQVAENERHMQALEADPLVIERRYRLEFNQQPAGEQFVQTSPSELAAIEVTIPDFKVAAAPAPADHTPAWARAIRKWLPAWAWSDLFARSPHRELLLLMSGGLLLTAFVLYAPRPVTRRGDVEMQGRGEARHGE